MVNFPPEDFVPVVVRGRGRAGIVNLARTGRFLIATM